MSNEPRSGWGRGFFWGCVTPILVIVLLIAAAAGYGGYYMLAGYKNDTTLQTVMAAVRKSPAAAEVLGTDIEIAGMPTYNFHADLSGKSSAYDFGVHGSKADGEVQAHVTEAGGRMTIDTLMLKGPDGHVYDLIHGSGPLHTNSARLLLRHTKPA